MSAPLDPPIATEGGVRELPAYVSNGIIGLRVLDIPLLPGVTLVNGFAGLHPIAQVESAARAPYPLAADVMIADVWLTTSPHQARFISQAYDFGSGELTSRFEFSADAVTARFEVLTFCSRARPTLALQEVRVEVDRACDVILRPLVDPSDVRGRLLERHLDIPGEAETPIDGAMAWESLGGLSRCGIALVSGMSDVQAQTSQHDLGIDGPLATDHRFAARPGRTYRLRQIASLVPSALHGSPAAAAIRHVSWGSSLGFERLREENRRAWEDLWRGRILIESSDQQWQQLADAGFFYLNSSVHPSSPASTSIFGLAQWNDYHYYYGHVMWDIDVFVVPTLLIEQPAAARALIDYRLFSIEAAYRNARLNGRDGLQYPWESGPMHGEEAAPGQGKASWHEDHVSLDVAWSFAQYVHATGDRRFLAEHASRVLYGVADWVASRVTPRSGGFAWLEGMGIAERRQPVDNDAYTIMLAKTVLAEAIDCAEALGDLAPERWREVARGLPLRRGRRGAIMSHDGYHPREEKGATPGPLAGLFPIGFEVPRDLARRTLEYYLALAPGYIGSPMLSGLFGVWAAWAGDRSLAARLLEEGYAEFVGGRFLQTREYHPVREPEQPEAGPFFANIGAFLASLTFGLPGIRLSADQPGAWARRPVVLPAGWRSIEIERAWVRGQPARIVARHGDDRALIELQPSQGRPNRKAA